MVLNLSALFRTIQKSAYVKIYLNIYQGLDFMLESIIIDLYYTSVNVNIHINKDALTDSDF